MSLNDELRKENADLRRQLSEAASMAYLRLQALKKLEAENLKLSKKLSVATDAAWQSRTNAKLYGEDLEE